MEWVGPRYLYHLGKEREVTMKTLPSNATYLIGAVKNTNKNYAGSPYQSCPPFSRRGRDGLQSC